MQNCLRALAVAVMLAGCGSIDARSVQDISAWGIGWQLKAPQNRIGPAIPPVIHFLRAANPAIESADPPSAVAASFRTIVLGLKGADSGRVDRSLIGVFTVSGQGCALRGYPVRDGGRTVAAFFTLDSSYDGREAVWLEALPPSEPSGRAGCGLPSPPDIHARADLRPLTVCYQSGLRLFRSMRHGDVDSSFFTLYQYFSCS